MNRYAKGANRERAWIKRLMNSGALWAGRTAGSHSAIDVASVFPDGTRLYQIKAGTAKMSQAESCALVELARAMPDGVDVYAVHWKDREEPDVLKV